MNRGILTVPIANSVSFYALMIGKKKNKEHLDPKENFGKENLKTYMFILEPHSLKP